MSYEVRNGLHKCRDNIYQHVIPNDVTFQVPMRNKCSKPFSFFNEFFANKNFFGVFFFVKSIKVFVRKSSTVFILLSA